MYFSTLYGLELDAEKASRLIETKGAWYHFSCPQNNPVFTTPNATFHVLMDATEADYKKSEGVVCGDKTAIANSDAENQAGYDKLTADLAIILAYEGEDAFDRELNDMLGFEPPEDVRNSLLDDAKKYNLEKGISPQQQ